MGSGESRIAILMAVYEPRMDWLREQLLSLNAQTYPNLMLYVRDDCSPTVPFEEIESCVRDCIRAFPFEIRRNEKNLGSNLTFERLTREAEGEYFAYCDQDDVWLPEKLEVLEKSITGTGALLVCSDMYIIDGNGKRTADSITDVRRHHVFKSGGDLAEGLLTHNFVTGCTMLARADEARAAVPFCPHMVHDHYIALWCAMRGRIYSAPERLISYRIHGGNQTGIMSGVVDKRSYAARRIEGSVQKFEWLRRNLPCDAALKESVEVRLRWSQARGENWRRRGAAKGLWRLRGCGRSVTFYEMLAARLPEWLFLKTIDLVRKNIL